MPEEESEPNKAPLRDRLNSAAQTFEALTRNKKLRLADRAIYIDLERCAKLQLSESDQDIHPAVQQPPELENALTAIADSHRASRVGNIALHKIAISSLHHIIKMQWVIIILLVLVLWRAW